MNKSRQFALRLSRVLALVVLVIPQFSNAQDGPENFALPDSVSPEKTRKLSLNLAIEIAIKNNLGIALQRQQVSVSKTQIRSGEAAFEPRVTARFDHNDSILPPQSSLDGSPGNTFENSSQSWSLGVSKRLQFGTNLGVDFSSSRQKSSLGSAVEPLFYGSNLSLSISQPLLRGFSLDRDIPRSAILRAQFSSQKSMQATRIVMAREIVRTENAYWNLVQSTRSYAVQKASLGLAREQLDITQRQIRAGILAPADLIPSESSVAQRELSLLQSEATLDGSMDQLRAAMNLPQEEWTEFIFATDLPEVNHRDISIDDAMELALQTRPEIRQNAIDRKIRILDKRVANNNKLPDLSLGFRYGVVGQSNMYGTSLSQLDGLGARNWGVFVNLSWAPLGKEASANSDTLRSQTKIQELTYQQFIATLRSELRGAIRRLKTAERQVQASIRFRELADRSLELEKKRFLNGNSRNIEVSRREEDLARARTAEISALVNFQTASSALDLATGSLLKRRGIELSLRP